MVGDETNAVSGGHLTVGMVTDLGEVPVFFVTLQWTGFLILDLYQDWLRQTGSSAFPIMQKSQKKHFRAGSDITKG